jgi:hypothetical protein
MPRDRHCGAIIPSGQFQQTPPVILKQGNHVGEAFPEERFHV